MITAKERKIMKRINELEVNQKFLPGPIKLFRELIYIQAETRQHFSISGSILNEGKINRRLAVGSPVLEYSELALDWSLLKKTLIRVAGIYASYSTVLTDIPEKLGKKISDTELLNETINAWYERRKLPSDIKIHGIDTSLIEVIIHAAMRPFLISYAEITGAHVNQDMWRRNYCPVCGGCADFSYLGREAGARWLICNRCDSEWLFQRLECPFCCNTNQNLLPFLTDDQGMYRLYVCNSCNQYLKTIDLRKTEEEVLFPLARFLTIDMDEQAFKKGYSPGALMLENCKP